MFAAAARLQTLSRQRKRLLRPPPLPMLASDRVEARRRSSYSSLVHVPADFACIFVRLGTLLSW